MAEILVYVTDDIRPDDTFQDGDVVCAFNDRRIRCTHAQHICHWVKAGFLPSGLRPPGLAQNALELTRQYRFERLSAKTVRRTDIVTLDVQEFSDVPNAQGEYIHVEPYLARMTTHPRHAVFGVPGAEVWYGGRTRCQAADVDAVWTMIEADTPMRAVDHIRWPLTDVEKAWFLALPTLDMRDEIQQRAEAVEIDFDAEQPEYNPQAEPPVGYIPVRKRRTAINWRNLGLPTATVLDPTVQLDLRDTVTPADMSEVALKPRINVWTKRLHLRPAGDPEFFVT